MIHALPRRWKMANVWLADCEASCDVCELLLCLFDHRRSTRLSLRVLLNPTRRLSISSALVRRQNDWFFYSKFIDFSSLLTGRRRCVRKLRAVNWKCFNHRVTIRLIPRKLTNTFGRKLIFLKVSSKCDNARTLRIPLPSSVENWSSKALDSNQMAFIGRVSMLSLTSFYISRNVR